MKYSIAQGNIIEENHYYSFGLKIAAISSKKFSDTYDGDIKNCYQMQGAFSEMDEDIGWNDFALRNYDPQIGRFMQLDPLTDSYPFLTPYQYASNDPITNIDIDGLEGGSAVGGLASAGAAAGSIVYKTMPEVIITTVRTANRAGNAYKIIKTTFTVINVVSISTNVFKTGLTFSVGRQVADNICPSCNSINQQIKMNQELQNGRLLQKPSAYYQFVEAFDNWAGINKGSHQQDGFVLTGGEGTTAQFLDKADNISGVIDIGLLLGYAGGLNLEAKKLFFKAANKPLLEKMIKFAEAVKTGNESVSMYKEWIKSTDELIGEMKGELNERERPVDINIDLGPAPKYDFYYHNYYGGVYSGWTGGLNDSVVPGNYRDTNFHRRFSKPLTPEIDIPKKW